jgi:hypothetical protein
MHTICWNMEPTQFFFLILPLTLCIVVVVSIILYTTSSQEKTNIKEAKELKKRLFSEKLHRKSYINPTKRLKDTVGILTTNPVDCCQCYLTKRSMKEHISDLFTYLKQDSKKDSINLMVRKS